MEFHNTLKVGDLVFWDGEGMVIVEIIPDDYDGEPRNWVKFNDGSHVWEDSVYEQGGFEIIK